MESVRDVCWGWFLAQFPLFRDWHQQGFTGHFQGSITSPPPALAMVCWSGLDTDPHQDNQNLSLGFSKLESSEVMQPSAVQVAPGCWSQALSEMCFLPHEGSQSVDEGGMTKSLGVQALVSSCFWVPAHTPDYGPVSF